MNQALTFESLVTLIRRSQRISLKKLITEDTELESELGITGDDGEELLMEIEKHFSLSFAGKDGTINEIFALEKNQYLFHSEAFFPFTWLFSLFGKKFKNIKPLTVGQLYEAAMKAKFAKSTVEPDANCCFCETSAERKSSPNLRLEIAIPNDESVILWSHEKCFNQIRDNSILPDDPKEFGNVPSNAKCLFCGTKLPIVGRHPFCIDVGENKPPVRFWTHANCIINQIKPSVKGQLTIG